MYIRALMEKGGRSSTPVRLRDVVNYWNVTGKRLHPGRPRSPALMWIVDLAIEKSRRTFPGQKLIRLTIEEPRSILNDS